MAAVVGIICEYDPFHRGHARQMELIRQKLPGASIVCVMSGPFTQRGMPALYPAAQRAMAALQAGADIVLELPTLFATREAEHFALGGVSILHQLGFVTHISFGCETDNLPVLTAAAHLLENEDEGFRQSLQQRLKQGFSFAAAQGQALAECLSSSPNAKKAYSSSSTQRAANPRASVPTAYHGLLSGILSSPNNILAISYLRALKRLGSTLQPLPVLRDGSYHAASLQDGGFPSATAVRAAILSGDRAAAEAACGYALPVDPFCMPDALDSVLLDRLRRMDKASLRALPDCSEGLENRLFSACREATSRQMLLTLLKTKRYPYTRLSRLCCHALLDVTAALQQQYPLPAYARLLGLRAENQGVLSGIKESNIPIVSKAADGPMEDAAYQLDLLAYDLWALGTRQPAGMMLRQSLQIL